MKSEVMVIGAGLAGLTVSALLVREGIPVVVVEQEGDLGGRLRSIEREGFRMDAGLHCFHYGDSGPVGELNRSLELGLSFLECADASYLIQGKDRLPVPPEAATDPATVPGFTVEEAGRIKKWFSLLMDAKPADWQTKSVAEFLVAAGFEEDELVRNYAAALGLTLLGRAPSEVSAGFLISHQKQVGHAGFHVSAIAGGPGKLIEALAARISHDHARIMLGTKALSIEIGAKKAARITTSGDELKPAAVVYTGPLQKLPEILAGDKIPGLPRACKKLEPVAGIAIELGLDSVVSEIRGVMISPEDAVIARFPSNLDPSLAPAGAQISSWLALVPPSDLDDTKTASGHIKRLKRIIQRQFPEIQERTKWERLRVIPIIAGAAPLPSQTLDKRPAVAVKGIGNLFLAGDGVSGQGALSGTAVGSAMEAARRAIKFLKGKAKAEEIVSPDVST